MKKMEAMSDLPDDLWLEILKTGVETARLNHRDLCCVSIACRRLGRLSDDSSLWSILFARDFPHLARDCTLQRDPSSSNPPDFKALYATQFEKDRERRKAKWRWRVVRAKRKAAACGNEVRVLEQKLIEAENRMTVLVRQASVALNVWQPEAVHGSQRQIVEQCTVTIESRLRNLVIEVGVCKQQIATFKKAYNDRKQKLRECHDALKSLKYNPFQDYQLGTTVNEGYVKRKKLKRFDDCYCYMLERDLEQTNLMVGRKLAERVMILMKHGKTRQELEENLIRALNRKEVAEAKLANLERFR